MFVDTATHRLRWEEENEIYMKTGCEFLVTAVFVNEERIEINRKQVV